MFQPVGGMDRVAKGFEGAVGHLIKYSTKVKSFRQNAKGVEIAYEDADGKPGVIKADYCICTIPSLCFARWIFRSPRGSRKPFAPCPMPWWARSACR